MLYILTARTPNGRIVSDIDLTAELVANARSNADRLGITILSVEEQPEDMSFEDMSQTFKGE